ncbi:MAG: T9SS type A sorting domain-containing protein, partial [Flavobacteriales bacterium]
PVRYENPNPNTPACEIRTYIFDNAENCSDEDVIQVNIDWSAPVLSDVNDGQGADIDQTNDGTQLFANWQPASDPNSSIDHYEVAIGNAVGGTNIYSFTNEGLNTSINVPYALTPNEWYYTTVKAVNGAGLEESDTSDGQQYIDITVGIEELNALSVYPNPTTGLINLPQIEDLKWKLFDATGRLVANGSESRQIDLKALRLSEQTYTLKLLSADSQTVIKLVFLNH